MCLLHIYLNESTQVISVQPSGEKKVLAQILRNMTGIWSNVLLIHKKIYDHILDWVSHKFVMSSQAKNYFVHKTRYKSLVLRIEI
jgi:hypothetical protein